MVKSKIISVFEYAVYAFFALSLVAFYQYYKHILVLVLILLYFIFLFFKSKKLFYILFLLSLILLLLYFYQWRKLHTNYTSPTISCTITSIPIYKEQRVMFYCKNNQIKILVYSNDLKTKIMIGDRIKLANNLEEIKNSTIPYQFDYGNYLLSKQIVYKSITQKIIVVNQSPSWKYLLINKIIDYYQDVSINDYILSFFIGNKQELDQNFYQDMQVINISHLFVVSGFHVGFLYFSFKTLFKYLKMCDETSDILVLVLLFLFLLINNFSISLVRAVGFIGLYTLKKRYRKTIDNVNLLSIIGVINILINPFILYDAGFILSYFITFALLISNQIINRNHGYLLNVYKINLISAIFSIPIIANFTFYYNFISWFLAPFFSIYYTIIIFPFTLLVIIFPKLDIFVLPFFQFYQDTVTFVSNFHFFHVNIGVFTSTRIILYYSILFLIMKQIERKKIPVFLVLCIFINLFYYHKLTLTEEIHFFDVGQGDSVFIRSSSCNALLDISGSDFDYHPGSRVYQYFQSIQLNELDYFILSHTDYDHAGDYRYIIDNMKVHHLVLSKYDESDLHDEIVNYAKEKKINIMELKAYTKVECGKLKFHMINPTVENNTNNDNSLVLFLIFNKDKYLFLGDISKKIEQDIVNHYTFSIDFIKIAHHGSKNSTSNELIENYNIHHAVISVGKNNYNHPSKESLTILESNKIRYYRTDYDGTISVKYYLGILRMIITEKPYNKYSFCIPVIKHLLFNVYID